MKPLLLVLLLSLTGCANFDTNLASVECPKGVRKCDFTIMIPIIQEQLP